METGRPRLFEITLSDIEHTQLTEWAASRSLPHSLVQRSEAILLSAGGMSNRDIARQIGLSHAMVGHWRKRFQADRLAGLYDAPRSGHPRTHDDETIAALIKTVLTTKPKHATHWSVRSIARVTGISKSTVQRYFVLFGVQPHRTKGFTLSTDPFFVEKVRDVVGLYINPPDKALVLSVDEKSQIQALERAQPNLPMGLGYLEGVTGGYTRHGTTTLFAALDVQNGSVVTQCKARHRHQEFLEFLKHIEKNVPPDLDLHLILDNYSTHKHAKVKAWLARRPRYHLHFTPTYSSWLNQVERWFGLITQQAIKRGSFRTVRDLVRTINGFVSHYNKTSRPFVWTATADSILQKLARLSKVVCGTPH
jgi:transposase